MFLQLMVYAQAAPETTPALDGPNIGSATSWGTMILYLLPLLLAVLAAVAPAKSRRIRPLLLPGVLICLLIAAVDMGPFLYQGYAIGSKDIPVSFARLLMTTGMTAGGAVGISALTSLVAAVAFARSSGWRAALPWLPLAVGCLILDRGIGEMLVAFTDDPLGNTTELIISNLTTIWQDRPTWILACLLGFLLLRFLLIQSQTLTAKFGSMILPTLVALAAITTMYMGPLYLAGYIHGNTEIEPWRAAHSYSQGMMAEAAALTSAYLCCFRGIYLLVRRRRLQALPAIPLASCFWIINSGLIAQILAPAEGLETGNLSHIGTAYAEAWQGRPTWVLICLSAYLILTFVATKPTQPAPSTAPANEAA